MSDYDTDFTDSTGWTANHSAQIDIDDVTNNRLDANFVRDATNDAGVIDLQNSLAVGSNLSDTAFVSRFRVVITSITAGSANVKVGVFGFSSNDQTTDFISGDGIYFRIEYSSDVPEQNYQCESIDAGVRDQITTFTRSPSTETLYVELIRLSATSAVLNLYSDSGYSSLLESQTVTIASTVASLRYFKVSNVNASSQSGSIVTWADELKVWTGITEAPQVARPDGDQSVGNWEDEGAATTNLYQSIDEEFPDDSDYVISDDNPATSAYQCTLGNISDPVSSDNHIVRYRYKKDNTEQTINLVVRLKQGATTIASNTHNGITTTITKGSFTLSGAEADNITDYTDLRLEFEADGA